MQELFHLSMDGEPMGESLNDRQLKRAACSSRSTLLDNNRLSDCHRTWLERSWLGDGKTVNWIMLNPSTADDQFDDPTIRKCVGFSKRWDFSRLIVTNLFIFRATSPLELKSLARTDWVRAVGHADDAIVKAAKEAQLIVAAWGIHGNFMGRSEDVLRRVLPDIELYCIGGTKDGFPLHPLMATYTPAPYLFRIARIRQ